MKGVNGEQALLAILLLLLTSLATVSGSMPVVESIETFFEEPMHTTNSQQQFVSETFTNCNTGHQQELEEPFGNCNREGESNFTQKENLEDIKVLNLIMINSHKKKNLEDIKVLNLIHINSHKRKNLEDTALIQ